MLSDQLLSDGIADVLGKAGRTDHIGEHDGHNSGTGFIQTVFVAVEPLSHCFLDLLRNFGGRLIFLEQLHCFCAAL